MRVFSPITRLRQLLDVLTTDRTDGSRLEWDADQQAYVHVDPPGYWRHWLAGG